MDVRLAIAALAAPAALAVGSATAAAANDRLPERLSSTGLYRDGSPEVVRAGVQSFTPQYALWSDGAAKRRWISLPEGGVIDATRPAAWEFPNGTRFWKEFSVNGRRVETRMIERLATGEWRFAAYVWNAEQSEATLAPAAGIASLALQDGSRYTIPGEADCRACHDGAAAPVLGFTALQLSPDRDALAPRAEAPRPGDANLATLVATGRIRGLPRRLVEVPPRITAPTPAGRAVLGYLGANCGHCHADPALSAGAVPVELQLAIDATDPAAGERGIRRLVASESRYRPRGAADARHVVPGDPQAGTLLARMRSRDPRIQMPPLGTARPDLEAIALIERWIEHDLNDPRENTP
jgi:hypothetical protein